MATSSIGTIRCLVQRGADASAFRYCNAVGSVKSNLSPNGSMNEIAGIYSPNFRVLGLMPHPENLIDPLTGGTDGLRLFESLAESLAAA